MPPHRKRPSATPRQAGNSRVSAAALGRRTQRCAPSTRGTALDLAYNFNLGTADNGSVASITNNRDTTRSQTFAYDTLNRITTAETISTYATSPGHCWGESNVFDNSGATGPWGNLTNINVASSAYNGCTQESLSVSAANNNQISGFCYDLAGNLLAQSAPPCPAPTYSYNAENQMTSTAGVTYTYDGDGKRVRKSNGRLYWYGTGTDALDETDLSGNLTNEYVFFGGKRIARRDASSNVFYYFEDHLGTSRVIVQSGQTSPCYDADFYPYGGERPVTSTCPQNYKFTGKERDSESGLDNFGARYDSSSIGHFMSPDPLGGHSSDPQTLNKYAYARNNPIVFIDPTGLIVEWHDSKEKCKKGETVCRTNAQRAYEDRLKQMRKSKDKNTREKGERLTRSYERLQQSKAVFRS